MPVNLFPKESHGFSNPILNKRSLLQSPQELAQILEKEVLELKSLLERERQTRAGFGLNQQQINGFEFEPNSFLPINGMSPGSFQINGLSGTHIPGSSISSLPSALTTGYHINCEDSPLNLKTNKKLINEFSMNSMQNSNYRFGRYPYNRWMDIPSKPTSSNIFSSNAHLDDAQFNNQGEII